MLSENHIKASDIEAWLYPWLNQGALFSTGTTGQLILGWGKAYWHRHPDRSSTWFYFPDYFLQDGVPWVHYEYTATVAAEALVHQLAALALESSSPIRWQRPSRQVFAEGFDALQRHFHAHTLDKVVLYVFSKSTDLLTRPHLKQALLSLLKYIQSAPAFVYGFWDASQGMLGATPELLFRVTGARPLELQTMALAGTQKTDALSCNMLQDPKLQHEHQVVVEDMVARLASFGKAIVGHMQVLTLPLLSHLYTPINIALSEAPDFSSFVTALHPTPALGGFPRAPAAAWLAAYDGILPRGRFGAPVGFIDPHSKQMLCYVAIRNMMWNPSGLMIGAGCGIVAESQLEKEWAEIQLKTESIMKFLNL